MSRIDNIIREAADSLRFVDPKSVTGRRALTLQGANLRTGNEHLLVLDGSTLYCTIEKAPSGWAARFGLQELSQSCPTLEACKEMIRQRRRSSRESLNLKEDLTLLPVVPFSQYKAGQWGPSKKEYQDAGAEPSELVVNGEGEVTVSQSQAQRAGKEMVWFHVAGSANYAPVTIYRYQGRKYVNLDDRAMM